MRRAASLPLLAVLAAPAPAAGQEVSVSDAGQLRAAVEGAQPGHVITLSPGTWDLDRTLVCNAAGTAEAPIVVRAAALGEVTLRSSAVVAFHARAAHWTFENLDIEGTCGNHSACEHAFHITGRADHTTVRGCLLREYNAQFKGNGEPIGPGGQMVFPDDVLLEFNELSNSTPRDTGNPVTPVDIVGGRRWVVRGNFIHDHAKLGSDQVSYAAFFKGNSKDGLFERNLVVCELLHAGQIRLGLSFGGGGSNPPGICEEGTCTPEHEGGVMRNNVIVNCPTDVGIYLNEAAGCQVHHNTLFRTTGIDVRFGASVVDLRNNLLDGRIRDRDGATSTRGGNLEGVDLTPWFSDPAAADLGLVDGARIVDQGEVLPGLWDDFCGNWRDDGRPDLGAVEYDGDGPCDTTRPAPSDPGPPPGVDAGQPDPEDTGPPDPQDAGEDGEDAAAPGTDAGDQADVGTAPGGGGSGGGGRADSGCGCRAAGGDHGPAWGLLLLTCWAVTRRR